MSEQLMEALRQGVVTGKAPLVRQTVQDALNAGLSPAAILNEGLIKAMGEVGRLYEAGEYFVPEMLIAARAMKEGLEILKPHLVSSNVQPLGKVAAGTVKGDLHDIGKNLVVLMLEGAGFEIYDLGVNVPPEKFVEAVQGNAIDIVAMSALLTTTMPGMKDTIEALKAANVRNQVKVIIGGAPVNETYAKEIGADGYAPDASRAVAVAKTLLKL